VSDFVVPRSPLQDKALAAFTETAIANCPLFRTRLSLTDAPYSTLPPEAGDFPTKVAEPVRLSPSPSSTIIKETTRTYDPGLRRPENPRGNATLPWFGFFRG